MFIVDFPFQGKVLRFGILLTRCVICGGCWRRHISLFNFLNFSRLTFRRNTTQLNLPFIPKRYVPSRIINPKSDTKANKNHKLFMYNFIFLCFFLSSYSLFWYNKVITIIHKNYGKYNKHNLLFHSAQKKSQGKTFSFFFTKLETEKTLFLFRWNKIGKLFVNWVEQFVLGEENGIFQLHFL